MSLFDYDFKQIMIMTYKKNTMFHVMHTNFNFFSLIFMYIFKLIENLIFHISIDFARPYRVSFLLFFLVYIYR